MVKGLSLIEPRAGVPFKIYLQITVCDNGEGPCIVVEQPHVPLTCTCRLLGTGISGQCVYKYIYIYIYIFIYLFIYLLVSYLLISLFVYWLIYLIIRLFIY